MADFKNGHTDFIMDIKQIFHSIGEGVQHAGDAIDRTVDVQRIKYGISRKRAELDELYRGLGQVVADGVIQGKDYTRALETSIADIVRVNGEIEILEKQCSERTGRVTCQNCGTVLSPKDEYCPHCGTKTWEE